MESDGRHAETARGAHDAGRDFAAIRHGDLAKHDHLELAGGSHICTRTGVGRKPLQGLLTCGQFEMTQSTSISARMSTWLPGCETPSTMASSPLGRIGTFMKKLMLLTMSRLL